MTHRHVERLGRDVLFGAVGDACPRTPAAIGSTIEGWKRPASAAWRELVRERLRLLGRDVETEDLDGHETVARRLVGAEHGTERPHANLVQHPERAECGRRRECGRIVSGQ